SGAVQETLLSPWPGDEVCRRTPHLRKRSPRETSAWVRAVLHSIYRGRTWSLSALKFQADMGILKLQWYREIFLSHAAGGPRMYKSGPSDQDLPA
ncbi:MAG: hypothetical protein ACREXR_21395, partial [Gammaproteobacteria bacterium]